MRSKGRSYHWVNGATAGKLKTVKLDDLGRLASLHLGTLRLLRLPRAPTAVRRKDASAEADGHVTQLALDRDTKRNEREPHRES